MSSPPSRSRPSVNVEEGVMRNEAMEQLDVPWR
jgi:hypothetical protein